jgi:TonB family protein
MCGLGSAGKVKQSSHGLLLLLAGTATLTAQTGVVPLVVPRPAYPPIALSARVSGDVDVKVMVLPNGTVATASVVTGPPLPLLVRAAMEAALESRFDCHGCETAMPYSLVFSFQLDQTLPPRPE